MNVIRIVFAVSVVYAVLSNTVIYVMLVHRKVPLRHIWAGTPGYLYRVCAETQSVGPIMRRLAYSTNVAFLIAFLVGIVLVGLNQVPS